jgi:hypothetical protein
MGKPFLILNSVVAKEIISYPCNNEKGIILSVYQIRVSYYFHKQ